MRIFSGAKKSPSAYLCLRQAEGESLYYTINNYKTEVFLKTARLHKPSPTARITPPTRQRSTFIAPDSRGVIKETVINRSVPPPREPQIESRALLFAAMLMRVKMDTKTGIRNIFAKIHIMIFTNESP